MLTCSSRKISPECQNWRLYEDCLLDHFIRNGLLAPTKGLSQPSPDMAMQFAPFGCTHPPPPVLSFFAHTESISKGHCQI